MKTKDRILQAALTLFNRDGTAAVSTNHIAAAAEISPGNLYYHFRNKEAIIRALCQRLFDTWAEMFQPAEAGGVPTPADIRHWAQENFAVSLRYAFVYRELPALLRQDAELTATYAAVRQRGYDDFRLLIGELQTAGVLVADLDAGGITQLADLLWLVSEQWLTALELQGVPADAAQMQRGADLMLLILRPYLVTL